MFYSFYDLFDSFTPSHVNKECVLCVPEVASNVSVSRYAVVWYSD